MRHFLCYILILMLLGGCASTVRPKSPGGAGDHEMPSGAQELEQLKMLSDVENPTPASDIKDIRPRSIKEIAFTMGVQGGVSHRYREIVECLENRSSELDAVFDFRALLLYGGKVLPPVIAEAKQSFTVKSESEASSVMATYRILDDAMFVTNPPSWRDYLYREYTVSKNVNPAILPQNAEERVMWSKAIESGWAEGVVQADVVFGDNLAKLRRDYLGMVKFKRLNAMNIVSVPQMSEGRYGIMVGDKVLDVDQRVFRIDNPAAFEGVQAWKPRVFIDQQ